MHRIKSIGVLSFAKISGLCYFALGLVFVPLFLLFAFVGGAVARQTGAPAAFAPVFGIVLAVLMPVLYGVMGFVFGAIAAFIYNLMAGWVGGIEVELQLAGAPPIVTPAAGQ